MVLAMDLHRFALAGRCWTPAAGHLDILLHGQFIAKGRFRDLRGLGRIATRQQWRQVSRWKMLPAEPNEMLTK